MRLPSNPLFNNALILNQLKGGEFKLVIKIQSSVVVDGTSPTISLDGLYLELEQELVSSAELEMEKQKMSAVQAFRFLEPIKIEKTSQTLTASTEYELDLQPWDNKDLAFLAFIIRDNSYGSSSITNRKGYDLGERGTIDIQDQAGNSLIGGGTAIESGLLKKWMLALVL